MKSCTLETLARTPFAHVQRCADCGGVSVHVGPVTLRFDEDGLYQLEQALGVAVTSLAQQRLDAHEKSRARDLS